MPFPSYANTCGLSDGFHTAAIASAAWLLSIYHFYIFSYNGELAQSREASKCVFMKGSKSVMIAK